MTADPGDAARRWLAEVIDSVADLGLGRHVIAAAILSAPGVTVTTPRYPIGELCPTCDGNIGPHMHTQVVIRLPAEEGTGM